MKKHFLHILMLRMFSIIFLLALWLYIVLKLTLLQF